MSIKLEWDVTEAPPDDEVVRRAATPDYGSKHRQPEPQPQAHPSILRRFAVGGLRPRLPRRWLALGVAALAAVLAGGGLWFFTQIGWQKVTGDVTAAVNYEDQHAAQGEANLVLNVQDRGNSDWLTIQKDEALARQPAPLPVPMLNLGSAPLQVAGLTALDSDFVEATVSRQFVVPGGQTLSFELPQFYHRDSTADWLRSAPPGSFWGSWLDWQGARLQVRYSERDAAFVSEVAPLLDQRLAQACALWVGGCGSAGPVKLYLSGFVGSLEYNPLANTEVQVDISAPSGAAAAPSGYFLSIPSPQIAGIPTDETSRGYLTDYLAVRLIAALARHSSASPGAFFHLTAQAIQSLNLAQADPGYLSGGQRRNSLAGGGGLQFPQQAQGQPRGAFRPGGRVVWYTTVAGDTLPGVAVRFSTSAIAIQRANRLSSPDNLAAGVKLIIPLFTPARDTTSP